MCALFSQGINETQSFTNQFHSSKSKLQRRINMDSFSSVLERYHQNLSNVEGVSSSSELLKQLDAAVRKQKSSEKNVLVLELAEDLSRALGASRITSCKSGKDRTAMAMTFEHSRILLRHHHMKMNENALRMASGNDARAQVKWASNIMRGHGVRLSVCEKNIGRAQYAFNKLQRKLLPRMYRPPLTTCTDIVTSFAKNET